MKLLSLSIGTLIVRFYLIMAVVIIAGFTGLWFLALLALPLFFSCLLGIEFKKIHSIKKLSINHSREEISKQRHTA